MIHSVGFLEHRISVRYSDRSEAWKRGYREGAAANPHQPLTREFNDWREGSLERNEDDERDREKMRW